MTDPRPKAADAGLHRVIAGKPGLQFNQRDIAFLRHLGAQRLVIGASFGSGPPPDLCAVTSPLPGAGQAPCRCPTRLTRNSGAAEYTLNPPSPVASTRSPRSCE